MMKLAKYKLIFDKVKMYTKKENTILKTRYGNTGIISLSLGGGICNYDVVKEHSDYLLSMAGNPVKSFSILTGRDSRYWNSQEAWLNFYKEQLTVKSRQLIEQRAQYDRLDAEFSNTRQRSQALEIKNDLLELSVVEAENGLLRSTRKVVNYKMDNKALLLENKRLKKEIDLYITGDQKLKQELLVSAQEGARLGGEDALSSNPGIGAGFSQQYATNIADLSLSFWINIGKNFDANVVQHSVVKDISRTMSNAMFNYGRIRYGIGIPGSGVDKDARYRAMLENLTFILKNEQHEVYYRHLSRAIGSALYSTVDLIINNSGL